MGESARDSGRARPRLRRGLGGRVGDLTITDLESAFTLRPHCSSGSLNPERISMPDFDIDFCQERRDEVIAPDVREALRRRPSRADYHLRLVPSARCPCGTSPAACSKCTFSAQVDQARQARAAEPSAPGHAEAGGGGRSALREAAKADEKVAKMLAIAERLEGSIPTPPPMPPASSSATGLSSSSCRSTAIRSRRCQRRSST